MPINFTPLLKVNFQRPEANPLSTITASVLKAARAIPAQNLPRPFYIAPMMLITGVISVNLNLSSISLMGKFFLQTLLTLISLASFPPGNKKSQGFHISYFTLFLLTLTIEFFNFSSIFYSSFFYLTSTFDSNIYLTADCSSQFTGSTFYAFTGLSQLIMKLNKNIIQRQLIMTRTKLIPFNREYHKILFDLSSVIMDQDNIYSYDLMLGKNVWQNKLLKITLYHLFFMVGLLLLLILAVLLSFRRMQSSMLRNCFLLLYLQTISFASLSLKFMPAYSAIFIKLSVVRFP